jgi:hypothetical protein
MHTWVCKANDCPVEQGMLRLGSLHLVFGERGDVAGTLLWLALSQRVTPMVLTLPAMQPTSPCFCTRSWAPPARHVRSSTCDSQAWASLAHL